MHGDIALNPSSSRLHNPLFFSFIMPVLKVLPQAVHRFQMGNWFSQIFTTESTGFHLIEIHAPSVGYSLGALSLFVILAIFFCFGYNNLKKSCTKQAFRSFQAFQSPTGNLYASPTYSSAVQPRVPPPPPPPPPSTIPAPYPVPVPIPYLTHGSNSIFGPPRAPHPFATSNSTELVPYGRPQAIPLGL